VIFDSCHSASGTRDDEADHPLGRRSRDAEVLAKIPCNIDYELIKNHLSQPPQTGESRSLSLPLYTDQASHVLLSACGSHGKAWEENGRGAFTDALIDTMRKYGVDKITYQNLIVALPGLIQ
jgi:hypothetical protein